MCHYASQGTQNSPRLHKLFSIIKDKVMVDSGIITSWVNCSNSYNIKINFGYCMTLGSLLSYFRTLVRYLCTHGVFPLLNCSYALSGLLKISPDFITSYNTTPPTAQYFLLHTLVLYLCTHGVFPLLNCSYAFSGLLKICPDFITRRRFVSVRLYINTQINFLSHLIEDQDFNYAYFHFTTHVINIFTSILETTFSTNICCWFKRSHTWA